MAKGEDITTKFKVDISDLKKGITEANNILKTNKSQLNAVKSEMDAFGKSSDGVKKSLDIMKSSLDAQNKKLQSYQSQLKLAQKAEEQSSQKVTALRTQLERAKSMYGENSTQVARYQTALSNAEKVEASMKNQVANLTVSMNNQQATVNKTEKEMNGLKTELSAVEQAEARAAKSGKSVEDELRNMDKEARNAGDGFTVMKGAMANLVSQGITAAIDGIKKLAGATVQLVKDSVNAYAQYEQLVGGVETLFGAGGQSLEEYAKSVGKSVNEVKGEYEKLMEGQTAVFDNAKDSWQTTGLSANAYMETVTGFSASLLQSLDGDTKKAAESADMAIRDMSDNANKMGTDMSRIQDAYQGFAKQNYTMLDNLKLGYGGTKGEMERLLVDAEKISGIHYDISSLDDVYQAIHVVQQEMGITGTTAKEASTTIQGSTNAMKAAWQDLLVGMADSNQDFSKLLENFIESVGTVVKNLLPVVQNVITSLFKLVEGLLPEITKMITDLMPEIAKGIETLLNGLITALPQIIQAIVDIIPMIVEALLNALPQLVDALLQIITGIISSLGEMLPKIVTKIIEIIPQIVDALVNGIPALLDGAIQFLTAIVDAIPEIIAALTKALPQIVDSVVNGLITAIPILIDGALQLFMAIVDAIPQIIPPIIEALPQIIDALINGLVTAIPQLVEGAIQLLMAIVDAIPVIIEALVPQIPTIIASIVNALIENEPALLKAAIEVMMALVKAIPQIVIAIAKAAPDIIKGLIEGLLTAAKELGNTILTIGKTILDGIKDFFGIHSPSTVMAEIGQFLIDGLINTLLNLPAKVLEIFSDIMSKIIEWGTNFATKLGEMVTMAIDKIKEIWGTITGWFQQTIIDPIANFFSGMWEGLKNGAKDAWEGIKNVFSKVTDWFKNIFTKAWTGVKNVFSTGGKIFSGIKEGIENTFKTVVNKIITGVNKVVKIPFDAINKMLNKIRNVSFLNISPFKNLWNENPLSVPQIPTLATGGVLKRGQLGLLEGNGAEAVVPLERNKYWIAKVVEELKKQLNVTDLLSELKGNLGSALNGLATGGGLGESIANTRNVINNYTQNNYSPKALSRAELYRQTRNMINLKGGA